MSIISFTCITKRDILQMRYLSSRTDSILLCGCACLSSVSVTGLHWRSLWALLKDRNTWDKSCWTRRVWGSKISQCSRQCALWLRLVGGRADPKNTTKYRKMIFSIRRLKRLSWNWRSLLLRGQKLFQIQHDKSTAAMSMKTSVVKQFLYMVVSCKIWC